MPAIDGCVRLDPRDGGLAIVGWGSRGPCADPTAWQWHGEGAEGAHACRVP